MLEGIGSSAIKEINLETIRTAVVHKNELKLYMRPDTRSWKTNPEGLSEMLDEFKIDSPLTPADFAEIEEQGHIRRHLRCMRLGSYSNRGN